MNRPLELPAGITRLARLVCVSLLFHLVLQLESLDFELDLHPSVPPSVAQLPRLATLRLGSNTMTQLPAGAYLSSLQRLDIAYTDIMWVQRPDLLSAYAAAASWQVLMHLFDNPHCF